MPSAAVEWARWRQGVLSIKYRGGDAYAYLDVPRRVWLAYLKAPSKGQFINQVIKPGFAYRRCARR